MSGTARDLGEAGLKSAWPVGVSAASGFGGLGLQEWVYVLTIVYTVLMIIDQVLKLRKRWKERRQP